jgi:hypothetical protein
LITFNVLYIAGAGVLGRRGGGGDWGGAEENKRQFLGGLIPNLWRTATPRVFGESDVLVHLWPSCFLDIGKWPAFCLENIN